MTNYTAPAFSEYYTAFDTLSESASGFHFNASLIQPGSTSDNPARMLSSLRGVNEIITVSTVISPGPNLYPGPNVYPGETTSGQLNDVLNRFVYHVRQPIESLTTADAINRKYEGQQLIVESLSLTDSPVRSQGYKLRSLTETLLFNDVIYRGLQANRSTEEANSYAEMLTVTYTAPRRATESLSTGDVLSHHRINGRIFIEAHVTADALLKHVMHLRRPVEMHTASDAVSHHTGAHRALREALMASQVAGHRYNALRHEVQTLTPSQTIVVHHGKFRFLAQTLTTNDSVGHSFYHPAVYSRTVSQSLTTNDSVAQVSRHNHLQKIGQYLTTNDSVSTRMLLPVEGYVAYNLITGATTFDLPDWGYILIESPGGNAMYWAPLDQFSFDPYREK
jgi:hypothetical protein